MSYVLLDIEGHTLTAEDRELLLHPAVFGIILFTRNYQNPEQLRELTRAIRQVNPNLCTVVDQEGGRVQRFREGFTPLPSMREWGQQFRTNAAAAQIAFEQMLDIMFHELQAVGVPVTLIPVLDLDYGISEIIGERSFAKEPEWVIHIAQLMLNRLKAFGMPATAKHFPGHGAVGLDSHEHLPIDPRAFTDIWAQDLAPYRALHDQLQAVMPAHIIYPEVDDRPAGFSPVWLQDVLRRQIGFNGLIMSDDLTMKATESFGDYADRARLASEAGCDVVTVCNYRPGAIQVVDALGAPRCRDNQARVQRFLQTLGQAR